jgi:hypothetical protein
MSNQKLVPPNKAKGKYMSTAQGPIWIGQFFSWDKLRSDQMNVPDYVMHNAKRRTNKVR